MSADIGLVLPNTPVGRVLHVALVRGYLTRIQAEELLAWSDWGAIAYTADPPAQAAAASPQAEPTAEERRTYVYVDHSCQSLIERRLLAMLEGAAPAALTVSQLEGVDDEVPTIADRTASLSDAAAGRFFLAVCHAYGPLTPARLAGWLAGEED
jgi:hypothetical protein